MAQFKRDRKIIFLSPLTSIHNFSEIRSHGGPPEGEGLRHSIESSRGRSLCEIELKKSHDQPAVNGEEKCIPPNRMLKCTGCTFIYLYNDYNTANDYMLYTVCITKLW